MSATLGICVATKSRMDHVIGLARAARKAGKEVQVFFTGEGVLLTKDPRFRELLDVAKSGSAKSPSVGPSGRIGSGSSNCACQWK